MQTRSLGRSGLRTAPLVFGGNVFGWTADEPTSFSLLDALVDAGFTAIDTANSYSRWAPGHTGGESETVIGKWLARRQDRERLLIATKVGADMGAAGKGLSRAHIRSSIDASLQRLQTDYVDLYQAHFDDPATPIEETLETFAELVHAGKVRAIGCSNFTADRIRASLEVSATRGFPRYESLQPLYNLYDREPFETELAPLCVREQIGVISYYALASGFLSGKYRSQADLAKSSRARTNEKYLTPRGLRILEALDRVAAARKVAAATVAVAWVMAKPGVTAPIASATSLEQLATLVAASRLELGPAEMELLDSASNNS